MGEATPPGISLDIAGIHQASYCGIPVALRDPAISEVLIVVIPGRLKGVKTLVAGMCWHRSERRDALRR
jgi:hypothetical protein